jgi:hypothetical protein
MTDRGALIHAISFALTRSRAYFGVLVNVLVKTYYAAEARTAVAAIIAD